MAALQQDFEHSVDTFRGELLAYCYRMLGSVDDAEDLVQETMLRAWRGYADFQGRASVRTWLYRIATNVCLRALEQRGRRELPSGLGESADPGRQLPSARAETVWLQPMPDVLTGGDAVDPADIVGARESMRLALTAAFQYLPARQRAVLILRDVLGWRAGEVATMVGASEAAVNSALQRARVRLAQVRPGSGDVVRPSDSAEREMLDRYVVAFESSDMEALTKLLADDVVWEMPPVPAWFRGRAAVGRLIEGHCSAFFVGSRLVATRANQQPAFGAYTLGTDGMYRAEAIQVLTLSREGVSHVVAFHDADLFAAFGLPPTIRDEQIR